MGQYSCDLKVWLVCEAATTRAALPAVTATTTTNFTLHHYQATGSGTHLVPGHLAVLYGAKAIHHHLLYRGPLPLLLPLMLLLTLFLLLLLLLCSLLLWLRQFWLLLLLLLRQHRVSSCCPLHCDQQCLIHCSLLELPGYLMYLRLQCTTQP